MATIEALRAAIAQVRSVYQPIVDLRSGETVAYEALARGPAGTPLERPDRLFAAAGQAGLLGELDWACRVAALRGALDGGLRPPLRLFVNTEPRAASSPPPPELFGLLERANAELDVIVEYTERALGADPAELLAAAARVRSFRRHIALDDVGADPDALPLLSLLQPDVVKLDLRLVQGEPTSYTADVIASVAAEAERNDTVVLAEGIETRAQARVALGLGARYGQGWLFGRPGPLPSVRAPREPMVLGPPASTPTTGSPFELVCARRRPQPARKPLLLRLSEQIERTGAGLGLSSALFATVESHAAFRAQLASRFADLARHAALVLVLGPDVPPVPAPGVLGGRLKPDDGLRTEWVAALVSPHVTTALVATPAGQPDEAGEPLYSYASVSDRDTVVAVARMLLARSVPGS